MPMRSLTREQTWLLPPTLNELVAATHPARFVAAFVDGLSRAEWMEMGIDPDGDPLGAPGYHPRALAAVWAYGFLTGIRSSRKLETACRDQFSFTWLMAWQHPDHNTLWRFYQAHREGMRAFLKRTVRIAVHADLVDLAVQAVDGTKIAGSAARERSLDEAGLQRLLDQTEAAIQDLEAQNVSDGPPPPPQLPEALAEANALQERVTAALERVRAEDGPTRVNLTDTDAALMKDRRGYLVGYNGQAMVSPLKRKTAGAGGRLITAADVTAAPDDHRQLLPLMEQAAQITEAKPLTLADGGYHSGPNLVGCAEREQTVVMPEAQRQALKQPYHKEAFRYDAATDTFTCPEQQVLHFDRVKQRKRRPVARLYRADAGVCQGCPAFEACAHSKPRGRTIETGPEEAHLRRHRIWMASEEAKTLYRQRKELPELVFGLLKEVHGFRRFLLRGLENVRAEWTLGATAFNLRTLCRVWRRVAPTVPPGQWLAGAAVGGR